MTAMILIKLDLPASYLYQFTLTDDDQTIHVPLKEAAECSKKIRTQSEYFHLTALYCIDCSGNRSLLLTFANDQHLTQASVVQCILNMSYLLRSADKADDKRLFSCSLYLHSLAWNSLAASVVIMVH